MRSRRWVLVALVLPALLVPASCGESSPGESVRHRRIDDPVRPDSVSTRVGPLRLLHIRIQRPEGVHLVGADSAMFLTIDNRGDEPDALVAVSSVDAQKIVLRDGDATPEPTIDVPIPAGGVASLQYPGGLHLELTGLKRELDRRQFVPMTFRFEQAGVVTVKVFVEGVDHPVVSPLP